MRRPAKNSEKTVCRVHIKKGKKGKDFYPEAAENRIK